MDQGFLKSWFQLNQSKTIDHPFIRSIELSQSLLRPSLQLVSCHYQIADYSDPLFNQFDIAPPEFLARAVNKRKAEYLASRLLIKTVLDQLAVPYQSPFGLQAGEHRQPIWPRGLIGSITHHNRIALCLIGSVEFNHLLGIDIENLMTEETANRVADQIFQPNELGILTDGLFDPIVASTLIFSAKESIFKAYYSQVKAYFGFDAARLIQVDSQQRQMIFELESAFRSQYQLPPQVTVNFETMSNQVLTCVID